MFCESEDDVDAEVCMYAVPRQMRCNTTTCTLMQTKGQGSNGKLINMQRVGKAINQSIRQSVVPSQAGVATQVKPKV